SSDPRSQSYIEAAREARSLARDALIRSQELQQRYYNSRHHEVTFQPGDLVLLWFPSRRVGLAEKLLRRYRGPYRVLSRLGPVTYSVLLEASASEPPETVHVSRLKKYYPRSP